MREKMFPILKFCTELLLFSVEREGMQWGGSFVWQRVWTILFQLHNLGVCPNPYSVATTVVIFYLPPGSEK